MWGSVVVVWVDVVIVWVDGMVDWVVVVVLWVDEDKWRFIIFKCIIRFKINVWCWIWKKGGFKVKKVDIFVFRLKSIIFISIFRFVLFVVIFVVDDNMFIMVMEILFVKMLWELKYNFNIFINIGIILVLNFV